MCTTYHLHPTTSSASTADPPHTLPPTILSSCSPATVSVRAVATVAQAHNGGPWRCPCSSIVMSFISGSSPEWARCLSGAAVGKYWQLEVICGNHPLAASWPICVMTLKFLFLFLFLFSWFSLVWSCLVRLLFLCTFFLCT